MRASEFIVESTSLAEDWERNRLFEQTLLEGKEVEIIIGYNGVVFHITDHYYDRLRYRQYHQFLRKDYAEPFLKKCGQVKKKMAKLDARKQFYVWDHESEISFGLTKMSDGYDGTQHIWVGTVITPTKDGGPTMTYDSDAPIIHMA